ncbi:hypothetical protein CSC94_21825 [Zhengella mangrovi]|uniref:Uncharacterized protein n=2 Tax=Zhengella mangrovi TaxID=1982044 RepID=A0A2G1QHH7_9HYPH|nr:hypothetical protein CSC94_21825 [Zhengella mangrovi]
MIGDLDILPKALVLPVLAYGALSWILGDVFSDRIAAQIHVPACIAGRTAGIARPEFDVARREETARQILREMLNATPGLSDIPGIEALSRLATEPEAARISASLRDRCACLAEAARKETRTDHAIWVATLRFYEPSGVRNFEGVMARIAQSGLCGRGRP